MTDQPILRVIEFSTPNDAGLSWEEFKRVNKIVIGVHDPSYDEVLDDFVRKKKQSCPDRAASFDAAADQLRRWKENVNPLGELSYAWLGILAEGKVNS